MRHKYKIRINLNYNISEKQNKKKQLFEFQWMRVLSYSLGHWYIHWILSTHSTCRGGSLGNYKILNKYNYFVNIKKQKEE